MKERKGEVELESRPENNGTIEEPVKVEKDGKAVGQEDNDIPPKC